MGNERVSSIVYEVDLSRSLYQGVNCRVFGLQKCELQIA